MPKSFVGSRDPTFRSAERCTHAAAAKRASVLFCCPASLANRLKNANVRPQLKGMLLPTLVLGFIFSAATKLGDRQSNLARLGAS